MYTTRAVALSASAALLWQTVDGDAEGNAPAVNPANGIYRAGDAGKGGLPIMLDIPASVTVNVGVASGATTGGAPLTGPLFVPFNPVGNDSMYGYGASGTVYVLVGNQQS